MNPPAGRGARARATRVTRVARLRPAVAANAVAELDRVIAELVAKKRLEAS